MGALVSVTTDPFEGVEWSSCSVTCGGGTRTRRIPSQSEEIECNMQSCDAGVYIELYMFTLPL